MIPQHFKFTSTANSVDYYAHKDTLKKFVIVSWFSIFFNRIDSKVYSYDDVQGFLKDGTWKVEKIYQ